MPLGHEMNSLLRGAFAGLFIIAVPACGGSVADDAGVAKAEKKVTATAQTDFDLNARKFLKHLADRDYDGLSSYDKNIRSDAETRKRVRDYLDGKLSRIVDGGDVKFKKWGGDAINFNVIYYDAGFEGEVSGSNTKAMRGAYLEKYFICEFSVVGGQWRLRNGFCMDEAGDPYGEEPDV